MSRAPQLTFVTAALIASLALGTESAGEPGPSAADEAVDLRPAPLPYHLLFPTNPPEAPNEGSVAGRAFGDFDDDGDVDLHDFIAFRICMSFSSPGFDVPTACELFDSDGDDDIDLADLAAFENAFDHSYAGVLVDAGGVPPLLLGGEEWPEYRFLSLHGNAAQNGFTQDDLWYEWSVISQPPGSGPVVLENSSERISGAYLLAPFSPGEYRFELQVTNLATLEFGLDELAVELVACLADTNCNEDPCLRETCVDHQCIPDPLICAPPLVCCSWCSDDGEPLCVQCRGDADCPGSAVCNYYQCVPRCEFDFECDDGDLCSEDYCDFYDHFCRHSPLCDQEDAACINGECFQRCAVDSNCFTDYNLCTQWACVDEICIDLEEPTNCDDGDPCTEDGCSYCEGGCYHNPVDCDDCNACTVDSCDVEDGGCVHTPVVCPEGQHCDVCAGGCVGSPPCDVDADCDDGLFCNGNESCASGVCLSGSDPCLTPVCDEGPDQCVGTVPATNSGAERACAPVPAECALATISLAASVPAACLTQVNWAQRLTDVVQVVLVPGPVGSGSASFRVPRADALPASTVLGFTATVLACPIGNVASTEVSIQMATAAWGGLPPCIGIGQVLDLDSFAVVAGQPPAPDAIVLITVEENQMVDFDFDPLTNTLEVIAGVGETLTIRLQVFGTAGLLAEAVAQLTVGTNCP